MPELRKNLSAGLSNQHRMFQAQPPLPFKIDSRLKGHDHAGAKWSLVIRHNRRLLMVGHAESVTAVMRIGASQRCNLLPQERIQIAGPRAGTHSIDTFI